MREAFNEFVNDHPDGKIKRKDFGKMMKKVGSLVDNRMENICFYLDSSREGG